MARGSNRSDIGLRSERGPVLLAVMVATGVVAIDATVLVDGGALDRERARRVRASSRGCSRSTCSPRRSPSRSTRSSPTWSGASRSSCSASGSSCSASILCGFAWDMTSLIAFRALQGLGAGAIRPMTITIVGDIYTLAGARARAGLRRERLGASPRSSARRSAASSPSSTCGAGSSSSTSRSCLVAGWMLWRDFHESVERRRHQIDYAGAVL